MRGMPFYTCAKDMVLIFWHGTWMNVPNIGYSSIN